MTITLSAVSATTPKSWVISITPILSSFFRLFIRSSICACIVTSRAVVGSSHISSSGSHDSAMAITALCLIPPENSCGYWLNLSSGFGIPTFLSISTACFFASSLVTFLCIRIPSIICFPTFIVGFREVIGS